MPEPQGSPPLNPARLLKADWEKRARSASRDFYVASHPGWNDERCWEAQAQRDVEMYLWQFDRAQLARSHVLEIGCGVGRLARHLAPLCASYTGIDIAPGMLETARARTADLPNLRFLENDGVSLPELARDRSYALALAAAVFIHCPRDVIAALMRCAWNQLESGGELRFQLLADPSDLTGLGTGPNTQAHLERTHAEQLECNSLVTSDIRELIDGHAYMGDQFRFDDVAPFVRRYLGVDPELVRMTPQHIYGWVVKV